MPTNVSYSSDESYSSSSVKAFHGNVLKQLLLAGDFYLISILYFQTQIFLH